MIVVEEVVGRGEAVHPRARAQHGQEIQCRYTQLPSELEQPALRIIRTAGRCNLEGVRKDDEAEPDLPPATQRMP